MRGLREEEELRGKGGAGNPSMSKHRPKVARFSYFSLSWHVEGGNRGGGLGGIRLCPFYIDNSKHVC